METYDSAKNIRMETYNSAKNFIMETYNSAKNIRMETYDLLLYGSSINSFFFNKMYGF
jgi:muramidase (phage lysozyme)